MRCSTLKVGSHGARLLRKSPRAANNGMWRNHILETREARERVSALRICLVFPHRFRRPDTERLVGFKPTRLATRKRMSSCRKAVRVMSNEAACFFVFFLRFRSFLGCRLCSSFLSWIRRPAKAVGRGKGRTGLAHVCQLNISWALRQAF